MSDEIKEEKKCNCCISEDYKRFLLTILASFLGCLVALCLYGAATKPQIPPQPCPLIRMEAPNFGHHRGNHPEFNHRKTDKRFEHKKFDELKMNEHKKEK
ncbi:hypothetical protein J6P92_07240 [bacterium]|nr:hypothetical protein [bacterium]